MSVSRDFSVINSRVFLEVDLENRSETKILKSVSSVYDLINFFRALHSAIENNQAGPLAFNKTVGHPLNCQFDSLLKSFMTETGSASSVEIPRFMFKQKTFSKDFFLHVFCCFSLTARFLLYI